MKKILVIFPVCLAVIAAYCGVSYWLGWQAQEQHGRLIAQINRANNLEASTVSYERGLFSSTAVTTFSFTWPGDAESIRFNIISSIYHGPFVFLKNPHVRGGLQPVLAVIRTKLAPAGDSNDILKKVLETIPELEASEVLTSLFIDGRGESYLDVPPFQKKIPADATDAFEVQWSGFASKAEFDLRRTEITGSWRSPSLQITGPDQLAIKMKDFEGDFNSHPGIKGLNVGSADLSISSIEGGEKDKSKFALVSLGIKAQSGVSGETVGCSLRLSFDKLNTDGMAFGPFAMEFEASKLDAEVLSRFRSLALDIQKKSANAEQKAAAQKEIEKSAETALLDLLAKSPEFEIKQLKLGTDKGDLSGRAKLGFAGPMGNAAQNIFLLIASIDANAELSVSEALGYFIAEDLLHDAGQDPESTKTNARAIVKSLAAAKYITSENGSFKSSAAYKHGALSVNGRKLDLSSLKHIGE